MAILGSKGQGPLEKSQEMPHYMLWLRQKKINSLTVLSKSEVHWYLYVLQQILGQFEEFLEGAMPFFTLKLSLACFIC
jgi:hypothetical protein